MEVFTGVMIAVLIFYAGKLIAKEELDINNFFSFLAAMMLAYQPVRALSTLNMVLNQGLSQPRELYRLLIKKMISKKLKMLSKLRLLIQILNLKMLTLPTKLMR